MSILAEEMLPHYIMCARWSSHDDETELDSEELELAPETEDALRGQLEDALACLPKHLTEYVTDNPGQSAHDLWLTRNHHGAGFWDRGLGVMGDELTTWAESLGEVELLLGDDGLIYSY